MPGTSQKIEKTALTKVRTHSLIPEIPLTLARRTLIKEAPTAVVYEIVDYLCGSIRHDIDAWEPETIWHEMRRVGITLNELQKNQVMVIITLRKRSDLIFRTGYEFKNFVLPINNEIPMVDRDEVVDVEHICWCVQFMGEYFKDVPFFVDYGALEYVAMTLHEEGFFVPPRALSFASERLTSINRNAYDYADMVRECLDDPTKKKSPIVIEQFKKMERVEQYTSMMLDAHRIGLRRLAKGGK